MADTNNGGDVKRKGLINKIVGGVILVAVILVIILTGGNNKDKTSDADSSNEEGSMNDDGALQVVQPVKEGDYEYAWQGVKWIFDTESSEVAGTNQTWVKMEFADFTRNGNAISFGRPYKLGVHPGTCVESEFIDTATEPGIPFAYATCEGAGVVHEFVVLQDSMNVVVKMKETKGEEEGVWKEWYKIDVTEIVR